MKRTTSNSILSFSLLLLASIAQADSPSGTVQDFSKAHLANGKIVQFDLDGDGKKENISLATLWRSKDGSSSAYRLKVNNVILDDYWTESDLSGNVEVDGFIFGDLDTRDRSKEIVIGGPTDIGTVFRIYGWRDGKIRRVLREPIFIDRFNGDGSIIQHYYSGWAEAYLPYRLNKQGELKLVPQTSYPLFVYGSEQKRKKVRVFKNVLFRVRPDSKSPTFEVKKGSTVVFDRMNNKGWAGAVINGRVGWILEDQVNADSETFDLIKAG
jgi:hypothetical protein